MTAAILTIRVAFDEGQTNAEKIAKEMSEAIRYVHEVESEAGKFKGLVKFDELVVSSEPHDPAEFFEEKGRE